MTISYVPGANQKGLGISYEVMRSFLVDYLATKPDGQFPDLSSGLGSIAAKHLNIAADENGNLGLTKAMYGDQVFLQVPDVATAEAVMWDMIIEGIVRPGQRGKGGELPFYYVTEWGKAKLEDHNTPYDPDGYLRRLRNAIPGIDSVIVGYITECLHTFRIGCLLSATITLGCAAEKAILLLVEAYGDGLPAAKKTAFKKKTDGQGIRIQYSEFNKMAENHLKGHLPGKIKDGLDTALTTVFNMFRSHRNDAGHPTGRTLSREEVYGLSRF